jgi:hypothetical protein
MAYMIYQQLTSAVKEAYPNETDLVALHAQAQACRLFLQSLKIDPKLSGPVAEPVAYIEEAFRELMVAQAKKQ